MTELQDSNDGAAAAVVQGKPELLLRIYSAGVLAALSLALTYLGPNSFSALILFMASLMAWEWGRVVRGNGLDIIWFVQITATAAAAASILIFKLSPLLAVAIIIGAMAAAFSLHRRLSYESDAWWSAAGVYYAGFPAIALIAIRMDPVYGFAAILYIFLVVWCADSGAYFAGRLIGGPKLAPTISPNKTWAGLGGAAAAACCAGFLFGVWFQETSPFALAFLGLALAVMAQIGDLGESAVKRIFGIKHSSGVIPGHGGVLDRLDGLVFAAVSAGLIAVIADPSRPGRALLVW